jgi:hypothetical protein
MGSMADNVYQVAEVSRQEADHVLVSFATVGFPEGFELQSGDRIVLVEDENGLAAHPLVRTVTVLERPSESGEPLMTGRQTFVLQAATVREDEDGAPPYTGWIIDRIDDAQGRVVAFRSQRR